MTVKDIPEEVVEAFLKLYLTQRECFARVRDCVTVHDCYTCREETAAKCKLIPFYEGWRAGVSYY